MFFECDLNSRAAFCQIFLTPIQPGDSGFFVTLGTGACADNPDVLVMCCI